MLSRRYCANAQCRPLRAIVGTQALRSNSTANRNSAHRHGTTHAHIWHVQLLQQMLGKDSSLQQMLDKDSSLQQMLDKDSSLQAPSHRAEFQPMQQVSQSGATPRLPV